MAQRLALTAGFDVIRSDVVRKELARDGGGEWPDHLSEGFYTPEWNDRTYTECLQRANDLLFRGKRIIVDATFREEEKRIAFLEAATRRGVQGLMLLCQAKPETVHQRLESRRGDASDAAWPVYVQMIQHWEPGGAWTSQSLHEIDTDGEPEHGVSEATEVLRKSELL